MVLEKILLIYMAELSFIAEILILWFDCSVDGKDI